MKYSNILCDPITKEDLVFKDGYLESGVAKYPLVNDIPVLLKDIVPQETEAMKLKDGNQKVGFSWALKHWEDLHIDTLLGQANSKGNMLLNFGSGSPKEKIKMSNQGYEVMSVDINAGYAGVDVIADGHELPFKDNSFDVVTAFEVLEHLSQPWVAIREINRVLKDGGHFVGSVAFLKQFHSSYFHMTHWGVKELIEYGGFELKTVYGGQNIFSRLIYGILPLGPKLLSEAIYNSLSWSVSAIRKSIWSIKHRKSSSTIMTKYFKDVPMSFADYDQLVFSPTVLFRTKKIKSF